MWQLLVAAFRPVPGHHAGPAATVQVSLGMEGVGANGPIQAPDFEIS